MGETEAQSGWVVRSESTHSEQDRVESRLPEAGGQIGAGVTAGVWGRTHLAGTLVGAHLEADGAVVHGRQDVVLRVVEMPSGAIGSHAGLAGTLVGAHLQGGMAGG